MNVPVSPAPGPARRRALLLLAVLAAVMVPAGATAATGEAPSTEEESAAATDARLAGYIAAWLEFELGLAPDRVTVSVEDGRVTLTGEAVDAARLDRINTSLRTFAGVTGLDNRLQVAVTPAGEPGAETKEEGDEERRGRWQTWKSGVMPPAGRKNVLFPRGDLFAPPLADQKQPRTHATFQRWKTDTGYFNVGSVGFGDSFGLVRRPGSREGDGWQLSASGAVLAIFNLDGESSDLLNADYIVGLPLSFRKGEWSWRGRYFHQSSHLGDEFLLNPGQPIPPVERVNLSFEALELLGSWERGGYRVYGGGSALVRRSPDVDRYRWQAGLEYRGNRYIWGKGRFLAGLDVQSWQETGWDVDVSLKAGLRFRSPYDPVRSVQILLEIYDGHAPHGQFYPVDVEYAGLGLAFAF